MLDRFFTELPNDDDVEISGPEAHHLYVVLRKRPGEQIELFDGRGSTAEAEILSGSKRSVTVRIGDRRFTEKPSFALTLATATPKGDRAKWLVEKATEIGVDRLIPLQTDRSVVHPNLGKLDKLRHGVIEACKQCRRPWLMTIDPLTPLEDFLGATNEAHVIAADPTGIPVADIKQLKADVPSNTVCVIGPEGGFTDQELESLSQQNAQLVSLGQSILRIETAGIGLAAHVLLSCEQRV
ncbi:MAG: RNA methyltransferase RsmE [Planctomycetaceae bacterium]|nr:RNA methyltransferase RsmE [Planctomycetaceae bacterium]